MSEDATGQERRRPRWGLRLGLFGLVIALGLVGWGYGWREAARWTQGRFDAAAQRLAARGGTLDCEGRRVEGFPFRIGLFCDRLTVARGSQARLETGAIRSAAQFYAPGHAVMEADGPAEVTLGPLVAGLDWAALQASLRLDLQGLRQLSAVAREPTLESPRLAAPLRAQEANLHLRRDPQVPADLDLAGAVRDLSLPGTDGPVALEGEAVLTGLAAALGPALDPLAHLRANGVEGRITRAGLSQGEGVSLTLSGPFSISPDGLLSGDFSIDAKGLDALAGLYVALSPQRVSRAEVDAMLAYLPRGPDGAVRVPLSVRSGEVRMGFFRLTRLPALF